MMIFIPPGGGPPPPFREFAKFLLRAMVIVTAVGTSIVLIIKFFV